jgi:hypothetical protein
MSKDYYIELGNPPGIQMDFSIQHFCKINATKTDKSLMECISELLCNKTDINLCLSGGIDSQFSLMYCLELNKNVTAFTYRSIWKGVILNVEDVYLAEQITKKHKIKHHIIDIDLENFYNNLMHYKYGANYLNGSPQISVHLYFIELLKKKFGIDHILMGGDPPIIKNDKSIKFTNNKLIMAGERFFQDIMAPYYIFCKSIGVECLRDIYYHSPEAVYKSFENNLDVLKNKKIYAEESVGNSAYGKDIYEYKYQYYKNIIPDLIPQRTETTGFETLKKILAQESGIYNQYDILYRRPQMAQNKNSINFRLLEHDGFNFQRNDQKSKTPFNRNIKYSLDAQQVYKDFLTYVRENELECINRYTFDF